MTWQAWEPFYGLKIELSKRTKQLTVVRPASSFRRMFVQRLLELYPYCMPPYKKGTNVCVVCTETHSSFWWNEKTNPMHQQIHRLRNYHSTCSTEWHHGLHASSHSVAINSIRLLLTFHATSEESKNNYGVKTSGLSGGYRVSICVPSTYVVHISPFKCFSQEYKVFWGQTRGEYNSSWRNERTWHCEPCTISFDSITLQRFEKSTASLTNSVSICHALTSSKKINS